MVSRPGSPLSSPRRPAHVSTIVLVALLSGIATVALTACGGGVDADADAAPDAAGVQARPAFHMAPAQLGEPDDAALVPHRFEIDGALADLATARLTPARVADARRTRVAASRE